jgi:hypothetical protein
MISSTDVGDYAAIASAMVAVVAVAISVVVGRSATRFAELLAKEERLWQRRADLYVELLAWGTHGLMEADRELDARGECTPGFGGETAELGARLNAFASLDVRKAIGAIWDKRKEYCELQVEHRRRYSAPLPKAASDAVARGQTAPDDPRAQLMTRIAEAERAYWERVDSLRAMIAEELKHGDLRASTWGDSPG